MAITQGCHPQTLDSNDFAPDREQRRKEVRRMIENLQSRRGEIRKLKGELHMLEARRSLPLPHELLELIFQYFVHSCYQLPEILLLVCRTFHVVAINCRALWTGLDPPCQATSYTLPPWTGTFIQSRVARSNPALLDIDFSNIDMEDGLAKKIAGIPTLLQRCRSVVFRASELHFFQGFQPHLESLTLEYSYLRSSQCKLWEISVGEHPNLRSLKLRTSPKHQNWPDQLLRQLTHLEIMTPLMKGINPSCHHTLLPIAVRLQSLTLMVAFGVPQPVIHQSLQTLVLVYRIPWMVEGTYTLGEIVCPELRQLEIQTPFIELLSSIHLHHTQKLSTLRLVCRQRVTNDEKEDLRLDEEWSDYIVELLRSTRTIEHLELELGTKIVSRLVERLEVDPTLCPNLVSLRVATTRYASKRERSLWWKLEARVSQRYQGLGGERETSIP